MKAKKLFYLKHFDLSLPQLRFSVLMHIKNFLLIFYKYITIKLSLYRHIGEQLNQKKKYCDKKLYLQFHNPNNSRVVLKQAVQIQEKQ